MRKSFSFIVSKKGQLRGIYSPELQTIAETLGPVQIRRASHVEPSTELSLEAHAAVVQRAVEIGSSPDSDILLRALDTPGRWWADMTPVTPNLVLGPFWTRDEALAAESAWLAEHNIPLPV